jgi:nitrate/TMAO reductase-like tetraheme cytochrome c subunit
MPFELHARTVQITALGVAVGLVVGVGAYTFIYAKGGSYLTDNPAACANCHIMTRWAIRIGNMPRQALRP